jgi:GNAT superfamily N-acetyltransferase
MSSIEVRPFRRRDRDQLAALVNSHAAAVVPGLGISVSSLLSELERQPGEFLVDPWVSERVTLVAEQSDRIVAAAHLLRYGSDERVGTAYANSGVIHWLVFWPEAPAGNPYWSDASEAAQELMAACLRQLDEWQVPSQSAEGELPVRGVYGVPEQWPHIRALYERAGFVHAGHTEIVYLTRVADLPRPAGPPVDGLTVRRSVGINGTRLSAVLGEEAIGYIEVEILEEGERLARHGGWADVGNLHVVERYQRRGVGTWLFGQAAEWLELANVDRLLDYAYVEDTDATGQRYDGYRALLAACGFRELTRTRRGWTRPAGRVSAVSAG